MLLLFMQLFASNVGRHNAQEQAVVRSSATPRQTEREKEQSPESTKHYTNIPKTVHYKAYYYNLLITQALIPGFTNPAT